MSPATMAAVGETHTVQRDPWQRSTCIFSQPSTGSMDAARIENCACAGVTLANSMTTRLTIQADVRGIGNLLYELCHWRESNTSDGCPHPTADRAYNRN